MNNNAAADPSEIEKFAQLADQWWDTEGPFKTLHQINPVRLRFIEHYTSFNGKKIMDIGCGGGILSEAMAKKGGKVKGIDLAEPLIIAACRHAQQKGLVIDYQVMDMQEAAKKEEGIYDIVTSMELLEHVSNPELMVQAASRLLKKEGLFFASTLNHNWHAYIQAIIVAEYLLRLLPKRTHDYRKFISPSQLARMGRKNNLQLLGLEGFTFDPLRNRYYLTASTKVNYLIAFKKTV